jgi:DNA mismatch repair protein MutS
MSENIKHTPMIQQYLDIKEDYADAIVFFRLGDFYEMFFDDAKVASEVLDITLTSRHKESNIPMCGIPYHASVIYIQKLIKEGFSVAIAEQVTEPGKGLVERKVTRLITPGTVLEEGLLDPITHNYLAGLSMDETSIGLSFFDMSTGQGYVYACQNIDEAKTLFLSYGAREIILNIDMLWFEDIKKTVIKMPKSFEVQATQHLLGHLKQSVQLLLYYVNQTQQHPVAHIMPFEEVKFSEHMHIEAHVMAHLDIFHPEKKQSLFYYLNETKTAMGSRLLSHILKTPRINVQAIEKRFDDIDCAMQLPFISKIHIHFQYIYDMYRLLQRFMYQRANPKDIIQLKDSLKNIVIIKEALIKANVFETEVAALNIDGALFNYLDQAIIEDPPTLIVDGGYIKKGFNETFDQLLYQMEHHHAILEAYLDEIKQITAIKNIKLGYQRLVGYYFEISKIYTNQIDAFDIFERKQTLKNVERYTTQQLKDIEKTYLASENQKLELEKELFENIVLHIQSYYLEILKASQSIAYLDVIWSLATVFKKNEYTRPTFNNMSLIELIEARHPIVEKHTRFIKNQIYMTQQQPMMLITGPNMSGKSTYMRMVALIAYMAQCGLFVPAKHANLPLYDAIFTRIGASDDISKGLSTFMTEMTETNHALSHATKDSLLLFDEIGRGTSTYDGMALAQGILEYIHQDIGCHTLFSTHYHELTDLEHHLKGLKNYHVTAKKQGQTMTFLHVVKEGKSDKSYGIAVASLANLPEKIILRSQMILKTYEEMQRAQTTDLFTYQDDENKSEHHPLIKKIKSLNIEKLTPLEALQILSDFQKEAEDDDAEY